MEEDEEGDFMFRVCSFHDLAFLSVIFAPLALTRAGPATHKNQTRRFEGFRVEVRQTERSILHTICATRSGVSS